mgnify:CR=1 FL=1
MKDIVLDASVAIKWFIKEEGDAEAKRLLKSLKSGSLIAYVPQIFFFEIGNVFSLHTEIPIDSVGRFLDSLFSLGLKTENVTEEFLEGVIRASHQNNITAYDASYITLAKLLNADLITADKKLKDKIKLPFVKLL